MVASPDRPRQVPLHRRGRCTRAIAPRRDGSPKPRNGEFIFTPVGWYEQALVGAGFVDGRVEDVTANIVGVAERWHAARAKVEAELRSVEEDVNYEEFQQLLGTAALVAREGRLARYAYTGFRAPR
jgi:hypothetical protein